MVYLVTKQQELFDNEIYSIIDLSTCLKLLWDMSIIQVDSETDGKDPHINKILCIQFGSDKLDCRIVVDTSSINISNFKEVLENKFLIFQNGKFDLQFLYNYNIHPLKVYDTMIVEQFLHLGYPPGSVSYSLKEIAWRRLNINLDKSIRSQIIWRGLDTEVIKYAASDVTYLEQIMYSQLQDIKAIPNGIKGAKLECDFVPVIAYLEWCGINLDEDKWKAKMEKDKVNLHISEEALNSFLINAYNKGNKTLKQFIFIDKEPTLFEEYNTMIGVPQAKINWSSSQQVITVAKALGFNTATIDKKTGKEKDSVMEKQLKVQKGINDEFLRLYFGEGVEGKDNYFPGYSGSCKVVTSFGQGHLNAINPNTKRLHTIYKQLGTASGRMSCGSTQSNTDLAKLKNLSQKECSYCNIQQLPSDHITRSCFVASKNNVLIDCDWSAAEARLSGDIYNDQAIKNIFLNNIDSHSMYAKIFFKDELKDIDVHDIKKQRPDLRQRAKGPEFALNFGGGISAIMSSIGCTQEEAEEIIKNYEEGFKGTAEFAKKGSKFVRNNGYVLMCKYTGHRMYWHDWKHWKEEQQSFTSDFWEAYKKYHKGTGDEIHLKVKQHFKAASKWDRMARNAPTQGSCAIMLKDSQVTLFHWIVNNNYFGKFLLCALVHDECLWECPKEKSEEFAKLIEKTMLKSAAKYCKSIPIPAEAEIGEYWKH